MLTTVIACIATAAAGFIGTNTLFSLGQKREDRKKGYIDLSNFFNSMEFDHIDELFKCLAVDDYSNAFKEGKSALDILRDPVKRKAHELKILRKLLLKPEVLSVVKREIADLVIPVVEN